MVVGYLLNFGAAFMTGGAGSGMVDFFHGFQVALMGTLMFNLVQFVYWRCKMSRVGTTLSVHTPTLIMLLSACMVLVQPMMILVIGSYKLCCNTCLDLTKHSPTPTADCTSTHYSYPPWSDANGNPVWRPCHAPGGNVFWDVSYCGGQKYAVFPTVASGWAIQILCTWGGFVLMFVAVMQATKLHRKLANRWRQIRRG